MCLRKVTPKHYSRSLKPDSYHRRVIPGITRNWILSYCRSVVPSLTRSIWYDSVNISFFNFEKSVQSRAALDWHDHTLRLRVCARLVTAHQDHVQSGPSLVATADCREWAPSKSVTFHTQGRFSYSCQQTILVKTALMNVNCYRSVVSVMVENETKTCTPYQKTC